MAPDKEDSVSLREFFESQIEALRNDTKSQIEALRNETKLRFDSIDKALGLAREEAKEKYEHLNKLRDEVTTDRGVLVPKEQCIRMHKDLGAWQDAVNKKITVLETRAITWTAAVGIFFIVINLAMKWFGR